MVFSYFSRQFFFIWHMDLRFNISIDSNPKNTADKPLSDAKLIISLNKMRYIGNTLNLPKSLDFGSLKS